MKIKLLLSLFILIRSLTLSFAQNENDCLSFQDKSEKSGLERWVTKSTLLLQHSDSSAYHYLLEQPQWTIEAGLSYVASGHYFLKITIIHRMSPLQSYPPIISASTPFYFHFLDETHTTSKTLTRSLPMRIDQTATYQYEIDCILSNKAVKRLRTKELDQLKLSWKNELMVFEIYDVDFFKRHFACLNAHL